MDDYYDDGIDCDCDREAFHVVGDGVLCLQCRAEVEFMSVQAARWDEQEADAARAEGQWQEFGT